MKLNLGCGFDKREGWLNVDNFRGELQVQLRAVK